MKAAIYARFSSDNQRDESIDAQVRACLEYAKQRGIEIVHIYQDKALTATSDKRPDFQRMIQDGEAGRFEAVLIHKLDRFSRDRYDHAYYKQRLKKAGVVLISVLENLDNTPESIILESVLEGMSEFYSKNLAREVKKGMYETALQCKHNGGKPPLGYDLDSERRYIINEQEADAVRLIFQLYASGHGYNTIVDKLREQGYTSKQGGYIGKNSIHDILKNEKYAGVYTFGKTTGGKSGPRNSHSPAPNMLRVPGGVPAIIDQETWDKVQDKMNSRKCGAFKAKRLYLLSGKIICGQCGGAMVGESTRNKRGESHYYYVCSTRKRKKICTKKGISCQKIEHLVITSLEKRIFNRKNIQTLAQLVYDMQFANQTTADQQIATLERQIAKTETKLNNIAAALEQGIVTLTTKQRLIQLEGTLSQLQQELREAQFAKQQAIVPLQVIQQRLNRYKHLSQKDPALQKEAIDLFLQQVVCTDDEAEISLQLAAPFGIKTSEPILPAISKIDSDLSGGGELQRINPNILHLSFSL